MTEPAGVERVDVQNFSERFPAYIELSSVSLGGAVVSVSDDFFAEAHHLLLVEPAPSLKGQFGPKGALYSGWESRRHNPAFDWCIIKLGTPGTIFGFDVDTSHFSGNEAPEVSVDALYSTVKEDPDHEDARWSEVLPRISLGPNSRHLFIIPETKGVNYVKLNMYPDGGIARFRVYGLVLPVFPSSLSESFDLAHVFAGGRAVAVSDQHFGVGSNLILPGRGKDMGDGWETRRSRTIGHNDWAILKLGATGYLNHVEIDTAHFKGNFPESCELHALCSDEIIPPSNHADWTLVLPRTKLGPHRQHYLQLEQVADKAYTHVKVTIYPDGGIKRVRVIGTRAEGDAVEAQAVIATEGKVITTTSPGPTLSHTGPTLPLLPLTAEAFAPFGQVIQAYGDPHAAPRGTKITGANQGYATKFHKLSLLQESYPPNAGATSALSVFRCKALQAKPGDKWEIRVLERHPHTNQAFVPMSGHPRQAEGGDALCFFGTAYLVIVAKNGADDRPDLSTMRAFVANGGQGIVYDTGIWHHPMAVLHETIDFTCVETQIGNGDPLDCEVIDLQAGEAGFYSIALPLRV